MATGFPQVPGSPMSFTTLHVSPVSSPRNSISEIPVPPPDDDAPHEHFEAGQSNLAQVQPQSQAEPLSVLVHMPPADGGDAVDRLFRSANFRLTPEELMEGPEFFHQQIDLIRANPREFIEFLDELGKLSPQELATLPKAGGPKASVWRQMRALCWGGLVGYEFSFMIGNIFAKYIGTRSAAGGAVAFATIGGLVSVLCAEPMGVARRVNHGSYQSPDGRGWMDGVTAYGRILTARVAGRPEKEIVKLRTAFDEHCKALAKDQAKRAEKAGDQKLWLTFKDRPYLSAMSRAFFTDELPVHTFSVMMMLSGALMPHIRARFGGPDDAQKLSAATFDMMASVACGVVANISYASLQNLLRARVQHADAPQAGLHKKAVHQSQIANAEAEQVVLGDKVGVLGNAGFLIGALETSTDGTQGRELATDMRAAWLAAVIENEKRSGELTDKVDSLKTEGSRNLLTAKNFLQGSVATPEGTRRLCARTIAAMGSLLLAYPSFMLVAGEAAEHLPNDGRPSFATHEENEAFLKVGIDAVQLVSMMLGWQVILCWTAKFFLWPPLALMLDAAAGVMERMAGTSSGPQLAAALQAVEPDLTRRGDASSDMKGDVPDGHLDLPPIENMRVPLSPDSKHATPPRMLPVLIDDDPDDPMPQPASPTPLLSASSSTPQPASRRK